VRRPLSLPITVARGMSRRVWRRIWLRRFCDIARRRTLARDSASGVAARMQRALVHRGRWTSPTTEEVAGNLPSSKFRDTSGGRRTAGVVPDARSAEGVGEYRKNTRSYRVNRHSRGHAPLGTCFGIEVSSSPAKKGPPFFIFWARGEQSPRAGESDAENRETLLTDFPEWFT